MMLYRTAKGACYLADMLQAVKDHCIAHVDLKDAIDEVRIVDECQSILGRHGFVITTLEDETVRKIRDARPDVQVALSLGRDARGMGKWRALKIRMSEVFPVRRAAKSDPTMLAASDRLTRFGIERYAKKHDLPILLWTVNSRQGMKRAWHDKAIWAFTTNYPRKA